MKKYEYMIMYVCSATIGRCFITTDKLIDSHERIEEIDSIVKEQMKARVNTSVIDFKLLRELDC